MRKAKSPKWYDTVKSMSYTDYIKSMNQNKYNQVLAGASSDKIIKDAPKHSFVKPVNLRSISNEYIIPVFGSKMVNDEEVCISIIKRIIEDARGVFDFFRIETISMMGFNSILEDYCTENSVPFKSINPDKIPRFVDRRSLRSVVQFYMNSILNSASRAETIIVSSKKDDLNIEERFVSIPLNESSLDYIPVIINGKKQVYDGVASRIFNLSDEDLNNLTNGIKEELYNIARTDKQTREPDESVEKSGSVEAKTASDGLTSFISGSTRNDYF